MSVIWLASNATSDTLKGLVSCSGLKEKLTGFRVAPRRFPSKQNALTGSDSWLKTFSLEAPSQTPALATKQEVSEGQCVDIPFYNDLAGNHALLKILIIQ